MTDCYCFYCDLVLMKALVFKPGMVLFPNNLYNLIAIGCCLRWLHATSVPKGYLCSEKPAPFKGLRTQADFTTTPEYLGRNPVRSEVYTSQVLGTQALNPASRTCLGLPRSPHTLPVLRISYSCSCYPAGTSLSCWGCQAPSPTCNPNDLQLLVVTPY